MAKDERVDISWETKEQKVLTPIDRYTKYIVVATGEIVESPAAAQRAIDNYLMTQGDESEHAELQVAANQRGLEMDFIQKFSKIGKALADKGAIKFAERVANILDSSGNIFAQSATLDNTEDLVTNQDWHMRERAALDENASAETLAQLASDPKEQVRKTVAWNKNASPSTLVELGRDPSSKVRVEVALNTKSPPLTIAQLAGDENKYVRSGAAANPRIPLSALTMLVRDIDPEVRLMVASNLSTPPRFLTQLSEDRDWRVRKAATENINAPVRSSVKAINDRARRVTSKLVAVADQLDKQGLSPEASEVDQIIAQLTTKAGRLLLGQANVNLSPEILTELSDDPDWKIRKFVASNLFTSSETLAHLMSDSNEEVKVAAQNNPNAPITTKIEKALTKANSNNQLQSNAEDISTIETLVIISNQFAERGLQKEAKLVKQTLRDITDCCKGVA